MRAFGWVVLMAAAAALSGCDRADRDRSGAAGTAAPPARPNILFIMADDLGYSDVGAFGSEIPTPNIDALASQGRIFTHMYATPLCAITRAELLSGTDHHLVGLGTMLQPRGKQVGAPGYEGYLTDRALSIAEVLRDDGYHTYIAGKWHLGSAPGQGPEARGFESSYVLLGGYGDHYIASPGRMSENEQRLYQYRENGAPVEPPGDFYSTDFFTDRLMADIERHKEDGQPFFAFAAYTTPHWPLQAPEEFIERHAGRYDEGYDAIRERRLERQRTLGIIGPDFRTANPVPASLKDDPAAAMRVAPGSPQYRKWNELSAEERRLEARRMEVYAAMVENLDWNIGRLLRYLKDIGQYENTLIVFTSDNGATGHGIVPRDAAAIDNSFENLGKRDSYVTPAPRWAEVSNTPLRLWKMTTAEGGVAVPLIVRLPGQSAAKPMTRALATIKDMAPTFAEIAGIAAPGDRYRGREVFPWTGRSLLPVLQDHAAQVHPDDHVFADESAFEYYVRQGDWKAVLLKPPLGSNTPELYNIATDRGETIDLASQHPDVLGRMSALYAEYVKRVGVAEE